jgi:hypothetical protein
MLERFGFLSVGAFGVVSILPNIMMSDKGTELSMLSAKLGTTSSGLFILSGITGIFHGAYIPIQIANILFNFGLITQCSAFGFLFLSNVFPKT